ncbi:MAG: VWA domain-containing protein [Spirochaetes bacterium]|nr:VWA domain-containing protein [Spirochaetota bacterium]
MLKKSQILLIFALLLSIEFNSINADSQVEDLTLYINNESLIKRSVVLVIDSSGSTVAEYHINSVSIIGLINANSIKIIRDLGRCSYAGIVAFEGDIKTTNMLSMSNDTNKIELEKFIIDISPKGENKPTNIGEGLIYAEKLLDSTNGTKEIIVLSDGKILPDGLEHIETTVENLKNKGITIQFIQIRLTSEQNREPNIIYNKLAQVFDRQVIVLNPKERATITDHPAVDSNEPCISATPTITPTPTITIKETPILSPLSTPENKMTETRAEEIEIIKTPGFEGIFTILIFLIFIKLRHKM